MAKLIEERAPGLFPIIFKKLWVNIDNDLTQ